MVGGCCCCGGLREEGKKLLLFLGKPKGMNKGVFLLPPQCAAIGRGNMKPHTSAANAHRCTEEDAHICGLLACTQGRKHPQPQTHTNTNTGLKMFGLMQSTLENFKKGSSYD